MKLLILVVLALLLIASPHSALGAGPTNSLSRVQIAWDPSPTIGYGVLMYNIYYGPASATYTNHFSVGTNTTGSVSNLVRGSTYFFAVSVYATNELESDFSNEVSYTSPTPPTPPTVLKIISGN